MLIYKGMKKNIHPKYHKDARAVCACGNIFTVGSTMPELKIELCSACHPFYTGKQKLVDTARRVEKFKARVEAKEKASKTRKGKKTKHAVRAAKKTKEKASVKKTSKK